MLSGANPAIGIVIVLDGLLARKHFSASVSCQLSSEADVADWTELTLFPKPVAWDTHGVRIDLSSRVSRFEFKYPVKLLDPHGNKSLVRGFQATQRFLTSTKRAIGAFLAVPTTTWNFVEADTINMVTPVAEIAEEHLVLVGVVVAFGADLAIGAHPVVGGDELKKFYVEPYTSGM